MAVYVAIASGWMDFKLRTRPHVFPGIDAHICCGTAEVVRCDPSSKPNKGFLNSCLRYALPWLHIPIRALASGVSRIKDPQFNM